MPEPMSRNWRIPVAARKPTRPPEEGPVGPRAHADAGLDRGGSPGGVLVGEEVVAAAQPVVVDPGHVGPLGVGAGRHPAQVVGHRRQPAPTRTQNLLGSSGTSSGESGRHCGIYTSPGSTRSNPSKNRSTSACERMWMFVVTLRLYTFSAACATLGLASSVP